MRIGVIPKCDKGNAKPFEAPNKRLCVRATSLMGAFSSAPSGLRLCINYVKLPVRRSFQAPLPVHSLYGPHSSHSVHAKSIRGREEASNICPCITKRALPWTPKLNVNDVRRYLYPR